MRRRLTHRLVLALLLLAAAPLSAALAYFTTTGSGSAAGGTATLSVPGSPAASASTPNMTVTWTASTISGSTAATSYTVERYSSTGTDIGTATCSPVPSSSGTPNAFGSFSCTDSPGAGSFKYKITAHYNSAWTATTGFTNTVTLTTTSATAPGTDATGTAIPSGSIGSALAGATGGATGTIGFTVFGPQASAPTSCAGGTIVGTATVAGPGTYHPNAGFTPSTPGTYWWYASYNGDSSNTASASTCGSLMASTVVKNTTATTSAAPTTGVAGTTIASSSISSALSGASTSPAVTGTITFTVFGPQASAPSTCTSGGTTVGTATVSSNSTYHPSASFTPEQAGTYWWYASYNGDTYNSASSSTCGGLMGSTAVAKSNPTETASAPSTGVAAATISASSLSSALSSTTTPASGTITYYVFGPQTTAPTTCTSGGTTVGTATVTAPGTYNASGGFTPQAVGTYWWYASYNGDSNNNAANSTCGTGMTSTAVSKANPATTATAPANDTTGTAISASSIGSALSSATSGSTAATGTITFYVFGPQTTAPTTCTGAGWTSVGTATVSGPNTYTSSAGYTPNTRGTYWWYASYNGDSNNNAANSSCGTGMTSTTVDNQPTISATGPSSGTAGTAIATSAIGASLNGISNGDGGTITFTVFGPQASPPTDCTTGGTTIGTATVSGKGTYHPSSTFTPESIAGHYYWYVSYSGYPPNYDAAVSSTCGATMPVMSSVSASSPTLSVAAPATNGTSTAIDAGSITSTLSGATTPAGGTITYKVFGPQATAPTTCTTGGTTVGTATVTGAGTNNPSAGYTPTTTGTYWWYASYNGDSNNGAATSTCGTGMTSTVVKNTTTVAISASPQIDAQGTAIATTAVSATLTGATSGATGTITFTLFGPQTTAPTACSTGGTTVGTATVSGNGTYHPSASYTPPAGGKYWWYVSYNGDTNNFASTGTCGSGMPTTNVWGATPTASATTTSGSSSTTSKFTVSPSTTYVLLVYRHSSASDGISSISSTNITPALTTASFTQISSNPFASASYEWAYYVTTPSNATGTKSTITVNFNNTLGSGQDTVLSLVAVVGNDQTTPIVTSNVATSSGAAGTTATGNLPNAPTFGDVSVVWLGGQGAFGTTPPSATGLQTISYANNNSGSAGAYGGFPAQQNSSFGTVTPAWGTIAFEMKSG